MLQIIAKMSQLKFSTQQKGDFMKSYYSRLITAAIVAGVNINAFCAKHRATRGALRSMIFKLWNRCKLIASVKRATVQFVGKNYVSDKKVGTVINGSWYCEDSLLSGSRLEWFVNAGYTVCYI